MLTCGKCNKVFSSPFRLEQHKNKIISCDTIIQCIRCKKIFSTQITLTNHINKQNPCLSNEDKNQKINSAKELKLMDIAAKKELKELDIKAKEIMIAAKAAAKQRDMENKQKLKELDIEKARLIEEARTTRKMLTVKSINSKIDFDNMQVKNQQIAKSQQLQDRIIARGNKLIEPMDMIFSEVDLEKFYGKIYSSIDFNALFLEYDTLHDIIVHILKLLLNNENYQNKRCVFYFEEDEQFYSTYFDINKMFIQTSFADIYAGLYMRIDEICRTLVVSGPIFFKFNDGKSDAIIKKFERFSNEYTVFKRSKPQTHLAIALAPTQRDILLETFMKSFENALSNIVMTSL
jgi:uncharacterized C2H2 Zn-finger protein